MTETYVIPLSYDKPPLTLNDRDHWAEAKRLRDDLQTEVGWRIIAAKIPPLTMPTVTFHWQPAVKRRRDSDNVWPTIKAILDQLVRSGVIADDSIEHVNHGLPVIHPAAKPARMWVEIAPQPVPLGVHDED